MLGMRSGHVGDHPMVPVHLGWAQVSVWGF